MKTKINGARAAIRSDGNLHEERAALQRRAKPKTTKIGEREVAIAPPNMQTAMFKIVGTAPYMQARFSQKAMDQMLAKHVQGSRGAKGTKKQPRDLDADYHGAMHKTKEGWCGIPAGAFRNAMISACRLVGFKMTIGKLSVFIEADGYDVVDGTPLVRLTGKPERTQMAARNATGVCDIRIRPMWPEWSAEVRVRFDADQLSLEDITNLLARVGVQVGLGEGRPDSRSSCGMGYGLFSIATKSDGAKPKRKKK